MCASEDAKERIRSGMSNDPALLTLKKIVLQVWPDTKAGIPNSVREYWNLRDKISVHDGLLFRGRQSSHCSKSIQNRYG